MQEEGQDEEELNIDDKQMMSSISSPRNLEDKSIAKKNQNNKKVIMHVNKFIPFYMQYH